MQTNVANQTSNITVEDDRTGLSIETLKRAFALDVEKVIGKCSLQGFNT